MSKDGYIRKIDELGRVVIPKEVRKKLRIHDNENIIITYDENQAFISKYSYISTNKNYLTKLGQTIAEIFKIYVIINDRDGNVYNNLNGLNFQINNSYVFLNNIKYYIYKNEIINESTKIGDLVLITSEENIYYEKTCKLISKIIELSFIVS